MDDALNWKADVVINPDALDVEWAKQASLFGSYCVEQAKARDAADHAKEALNIKYAQLDLKVRSNPAVYGLDKPTEGGIRATIILDKDYQASAELLAKAQFNLEVMTAAVRALDQKKAALENLVRLAGQNYFAGPSVPRDLTKEWAADLQRQASRTKAKAAAQSNGSTGRRVVTR